MIFHSFQSTEEHMFRVFHICTWFLSLMFHIVQTSTHFHIKNLHIYLAKKKKKKIFPEFSLQKLIQMNFKVSTITKKKLTYIMNLNLLTQCIFAMLTTCTWIHTSMNHDNELAGILTSTSTLICFEFINVYCRTAQYFFRIMRGNCS